METRFEIIKKYLKELDASELVSLWNFYVAVMSPKARDNLTFKLTRENLDETLASFFDGSLFNAIRAVQQSIADEMFDLDDEWGWYYDGRLYSGEFEDSPVYEAMLADYINTYEDALGHEGLVAILTTFRVDGSINYYALTTFEEWFPGYGFEIKRI